MHTDVPRDEFDAIVIGGSYAGLSAALVLARTRRRLLVIDAGVRRNRFAHASHGFLGQDGRAPADIAAAGRAEVLAYPHVRWIDGIATHAAKTDHGFDVTVQPSDTADAAGAAAPRTVRAQRLVLAPGVSDDLPEIEGIAERWGRGVFHCPYCHGYELNQGRIGVLAVGSISHHQAMLLPDWGQVTLFTNEVYAPDDAEQQTLRARGVTIEPARVLRVVDHATVELADGRRIALDGLFTASRFHLSSPIAEQLACEFDEGPTGRYIRVDAMKQTTVPGVFACGDATRPAGNVALAVGDGAQAGMATHRSLIYPS